MTGPQQNSTTVSKEDAEAFAEKLLTAAREERERVAARETRFLTFVYPVSAKLPASERRAEVRLAREKARRDEAAIVSGSAAILATIAFLAAFFMGLEYGGSLLWVAFGTALVDQFVHYMQTRRHLLCTESYSRVSK